MLLQAIRTNLRGAFKAFTLPTGFSGEWAPENHSRLRILLLADDRHEANVVQDHINAFRRHSRNDVFVVNPIHTDLAHAYPLSKFDAILIHYSILTLSDYFLSPSNRAAVEAFCGVKAQIIQDEHRWVNDMQSRMVSLGVSCVFSSLNELNVERVYQQNPKFDGISVYSTLPGYVPEHLCALDSPSMGDRRLDVIYRGRTLPYWAGAGAREKLEIGHHFLRIAGQYGGLIDIAVDEGSRIYGDSWTDFLMSSRTMLATEGGVSIFDFDGEAERTTNAYLKVHPDASPADMKKVLKKWEGNVVHRTITPKILEAILTRTALIMYPGKFRNLLEPNEHYIVLDRDGANAAEVYEKINDHAYLQDLADRTHAFVTSKHELSFEHYVACVEDGIEQALNRWDQN